jgi:uncharacterized lipoprotein YddW (UPF0748 family)
MEDARSSYQRSARKFVVLLCVVLSACTNAPFDGGTSGGLSRTALTCPAQSTADCPPPAPREFRAAWVATVANIDWPSKQSLTTAQQQAEIIAIVDRAAELNLNALVLQVRTSADAFYPSSLEPWSEFLTGEQGRAPSPFYDPLKMWIDEAHKRGIELHAWFNPYRARHVQAKSANARNHLANTQPALIKSYGGFLWMDPGEPKAADHTLNVVMDVLRRYDIDGVHIDDYFYPYPVVATQEVRQVGASRPALSDGVAGALNQTVVAEPQRDIEFPDDAAWQRFVASGGKISRADWRRQNVNQLVERIYTSIKREKPWVQFGISPFGIGRPDKRPAGISGFSQYDKLFADIELWLQRGWLDYLAPQLYWPIDQKAQAFPVLLDYWHRENTSKRNIYVGLFTSRIDDTPRSWLPAELNNQIELIRARAEPKGHIHFSTIPIMQNRKGIADELRRSNAQQALVPQATVIPATATPVGTVEASIAEVSANQRRALKLKVINGASLNTIAVWLRYGNNWQFSVLPALRAADGSYSAETMVSDAIPAGQLDSVVISAVDRFGVEGERRLVRLAQP